MHIIGRYVLAVAACGIGLSGAAPRAQDCPARPYPDTEVKNPLDLRAGNGVLKVPLTLRSREMMELPFKACYVYEAGSASVEAPTLRLDPGDWLELTLTDRLTYVRPHAPVPPSSPAPHDPCAGGTIATTSTNIDFHGLNIPADCHQGEVSATTIENTDPAFGYRFQVPADNPPGMYWYHPHLLGSETLQLNGGASGVVIVSGMEKAKPDVAGLPERILVVRQQFEEPDSWPPGEYRLSLNFQPAAFPQLPSPVIRMKPGAREFWRVANATSQVFLALQVQFGNAAQQVRLVALDGVPLPRSRDLKTIELPPGGRAEFTVTGPPSGQAARLLQTEFETGRTGLESPAQELARIVAVDDALEPPSLGEPASVAAPPRCGSYISPKPPMAPADPRDSS
jgi:FtsP/CotA-like multicopper oxidase with cupredoxin domain